MPDQPPKPPHVATVREELAALTALLRAHVQAQADLGLDACALPPDAWVGWQRDALRAEDLRWDGQAPPSPKAAPKGLPDVAAIVQRDPRQPPPKAAAPTAATTPAASISPAAPTLSAPTQRPSAPPAPLPSTTPPAATPAPKRAPSLLPAQGLFQDTLQRGAQPSVLDATARPSLESIYAEARACRRCPMFRSRTQAVVGQGDPSAQLLIITPPPSPAEDRAGLPLVGPAGDLFDKMLKAMTLSRERVFITPVIKCRPPGDDDPSTAPPPDLPTALATCEGFLNGELDHVRATVVLALGRVAAQHLLRVKTPISVLRGQWQTFRGMSLMPTLHPADLLNRPEAKPLVWQDLQRVMERLGIKRP